MKSCSGSLWGSGCARSFAIMSRHTAALLPPLPIPTGAGWGPWLFPGGAGPYQPAQVLEADVELVPPADLAPVRGVDVICREEGGQRQCSVPPGPSKPWGCTARVAGVTPREPPCCKGGKKLQSRLEVLLHHWDEGMQPGEVPIGAAHSSGVFPSAPSAGAPLLPQWLPRVMMPSWGSSKMRAMMKKNIIQKAPQKQAAPRVPSQTHRAPHLPMAPLLAVLPPGLAEGFRKGQGAKRRALHGSKSRASCFWPGPLLPSVLGAAPLLLPKIPGSLLGCGRSFVFLGCLLLGALAARVTRTGLLLARKNVTMKGCLERGPRRPNSPAEPGSTLSPAGMEQEQVAGRSSAGGALLGLHRSWDHNCRAEPCCHTPLTNGTCCSWGFGPKH